MTREAAFRLGARLWLAVCAALLALFVAPPLSAQVAVTARATVSKVEVGQRFQVDLTASSNDRSQASDPRLPVPPGVSISGPSIGTRTQVSLGMGGMRQETSTTASWILVASRPGTLKLGPPSVEANGKRFAGPMVVVEVVPEGTLPRAPTPRGRPGFNPFDWLDPFGQGASPFPPGFGPNDQQPEEQLPPVPEEMRVDVAPDPIAFVRAVVTPKRPVVGEQVTLHVYAYGGRYRSRTPIVRSSPALEIDVEEPPLQGRPPGYKLGDVGQMSLDVTVEPKTVVAGDAIAVSAKLEGSGNLPATLLVPQKRGVEWLEPTVISNVEPKRNGVGGSRNFTYVVKMSEAGNVDLGSLTLPYFDPKKRAYAVARAELGSINVTPNPKAAASAAASGAPGALGAPGSGTTAFGPRKELRSFQPPSPPFTDDLRFWMLLFGAPVAVTLAGVGVALGGRMKQHSATRRVSPERLADEALRAAGTAADGEQVAATATAVERALFLAIEAGTQIRGRGLMRSELGPALVAAGVPADLSERTVALLDACEDARFTGKAGELSPKALHSRARELVSQLARKRRSQA